MFLFQGRQKGSRLFFSKIGCPFLLLLAIRFFLVGQRLPCRITRIEHPGIVQHPAVSTTQAHLVLVVRATTILTSNNNNGIRDNSMPCTLEVLHHHGLRLIAHNSSHSTECLLSNMTTKDDLPLLSSPRRRNTVVRWLPPVLQ